MCTWAHPAPEPGPVQPSVSNRFIKSLLANLPSRGPATGTPAAPFPGEPIPSRLEGAGIMWAGNLSRSSRTHGILVPLSLLYFPAAAGLAPKWDIKFITAISNL